MEWSYHCRHRAGTQDVKAHSWLMLLAEVAAGCRRISSLCAGGEAVSSSTNENAARQDGARARLELAHGITAWRGYSAVYHVAFSGLSCW